MAALSAEIMVTVDKKARLLHSGINPKRSIGAIGLRAGKYVGLFNRNNLRARLK